MRTVSSNNPFKNTGGYDNTHSYMQGYAPDWSRKAAVLKRQSVKGADIFHKESRLRQDNLFDTALEIRPDHDGAMIVPCDEGSGVSGQKKIYERKQLLEAWDGILDDTLGTIFVAREDRLFRHRHLSQVGLFTEECQKHNVLVIVAGKRCYDFSRDDDLKTFIRKMEEAYAYLKHIEYMIACQLQKQQRGEWIGGFISVPYAMDIVAQNRVKEQIKLRKYLGELDIEFTEEMSMAYRPVIYQPWLDRAIDLFEKFKLFNFQAPRLMRYIEEKPCLFPYPTAEDNIKYLFPYHMKQVGGTGYTFSRPLSIYRWMTNPLHIGSMVVGKEEIGTTKGGKLIYEPIYMENCFEGILSREEFEEYYIEIKGEDLNGNPVEDTKKKARFTREYPTGATNNLLRELFISEHLITNQARQNGRHSYTCRTRNYQPGLSEHAYLQTVLWALPASQIDREVVNRLDKIADCDTEMKNRVKAYFSQLAESHVNQKKSIQDDIVAIEKRIAYYDGLIGNPENGLSSRQIAVYAEKQEKAYQELEVAQHEMSKQNALQPEKIIPNFYQILDKVSDEFWKLDIDKQRWMLSKLIEGIEIKNIAPHIFILTVKWLRAVAKCPDTTLIYRGASSRGVWTPEEDAWLRASYLTGDKLEILKHFPERTWAIIRCRASELDAPRAIRQRGIIIHDDLTYNDWIKLCEYSKIDHESEEGQQILDRLNSYAAETSSKEIAPFNWFMPVDEVSVTKIIRNGTNMNSILEASEATLMKAYHL
jgi:hypothetical protein